MMIMEKGLADITKEKEETKEKEPSVELIKMRQMLQSLKNRDLAISNPKEYKELSCQVYKDLCSFFTEEEAEFVTDVNNIYREYGKNISSPLIVRRENPEKVIDLSEGFDINIGFNLKVAGSTEDKYANCSIWPYGQNAVSGIRNAFLEGHGMIGPIVTLIGVNYNPEKTTIEKIDPELQKVGDINREAVRILSGTITKEDLKFIILRIQKDFFPNESLTDQEKKEEIKQIFRGFTF